MTRGKRAVRGRLLAGGIGFVVASVLAVRGVQSQGFNLPGTQPQGTAPSADVDHLFVPPAGAVPYGVPCMVCHANSDTPLATPLNSWQGSMMSQAARDPLFYAQLDLANSDNATRPEVAGMGDMCLRCHSPVGWLEGRSGTPSGQDFIVKDLFGVQCHACHRMADPNLAVADPSHFDVTNFISLMSPSPGIPPTYGNGMYVMDPKQTRRGPYALSQLSAHLGEVVGEGLDWTAVTTATGHPVMNSPFHRSGNLCATCHDVSNPVDCLPGFTGQDTQKCFPIERTATEWRHSVFPSRGEAGNCQSCHMSGPLNSVAFGAPCEGANGLAHLNDIHFHDLTGGNGFIPLVIKDMKQRYDAACAPGDTACTNFKAAVEGLYPPATGSPFGDVDIPALDAGVARVKRTLKRAAYLDVTAVSPNLAVRVTNRTGHKLPTGYPEGRRMWLNVRFLNASGALIAESGRYDQSTGSLYHDQDLSGAVGLKTYDVVEYTNPAGGAFGSGRATKVWEGRLEHQATGTEFHFALNDGVRMDNRIPPEGWDPVAYTSNRADPFVPANYLANGWQATYAPGVNFDDVSYSLPPGTDRVELTLYYQTASREYIEAVRDDNPDTLAAGGFNRGELLHDAWQRPLANRSQPIPMARRVHAIVDADGDQLSDGWEAGAPPLGGYNDDFDGDGLSNWQEFQEGSDPRDVNSPTMGGVRGPIDVVLVLDLSGSMNDPAPGTTVPKIQILRDAVTLFLQTWKDYAIPGDRIGVVYFRTDWTQFGAPPLLKSFVTELPAIQSDVQGQVASGWTAMGAGLHTALQALGDPSRPRHVILFSNGMQNRSPMIVPDINGVLVIRDQTSAQNPDVTGPSNVVIGGSDYTIPAGVQVHSIGIGVAPNGAGTAWHALLRDLAAQHNGKHNFITRAFDLEGVFLEDLVNALRGSSLEYIFEEERVLPAGGDQVFEIPINGTATKFTLLLSWSGQQGPAPAVQLLRPDGNSEDLSPLLRTGSFYRVITRFLSDRDEHPEEFGVWKLRVSGSRKPAPDRPSADPPPAAAGLRLRLHAVLDDAEVKYQFSVPIEVLRLGQPLLVSASATQGNRLLKAVDRVTVTLDRPRASVGAALARSRHQLADPASFDPDLASSPFSRKLLAAFSDAGWRQQLAGVETTHALLDDGRNGDGTAGDGIFSRTLVAPTVPGHYLVRFRMEGHSADGRIFVRKESFSVLVKIGHIDEGRSRVRRVDQAGRTYVVFEPRDRTNNVLGPGYAGQVHVLAKGTPLVVEDLLDGRYRAPLPPGFTPADLVQIRLDGRAFHDGPVRELTPLERVPWWLWLLLLIVLLVLVVVAIVMLRR